MFLTRLSASTAVRVAVAAFAVSLLPVAASAQHKIPDLPETAQAPVKKPSGLKIIDIKVGSGVVAEKGRLVRVAFTGWVTKTQIMFDFREPNAPLAFHVGRPDPAVLKGIDEGVLGMKVGGKRRLIVPPRLGHGSRATKLVPPNSELTIDVELVAVARPGV